ncbi:LysR family transcriptional regulator [Gorillibacterium massiliense]|uniref:LysR family transcriptional regulator n=1 Tax=Gorillibacterium massiliense TaxID=1280390 RepID=UPI0005952802|nr:LysR family transcriptional regulator [Gorillibacterium massiliense]
MNLHALKIYCRVAEKGSVTRAAEELLLSQPAVTVQVRNLEKELGVRLLAPKGRGILLTEAGELLAEEGRRLLAVEQETERRMSDWLAGKQGRLQIAATYLPATVLLPGWLARFKMDHPGITITMDTGNTRDVFSRLDNYKADIAFVGGVLHEMPEYRHTLLLTDEMIFVVPVSHPWAGQEVSLEQILKMPFVLREPGSSARERLFSLCWTRGLPEPEIGLQFNGLREIIRAVAAGYGAAYVSRLEAWDFLSGKQVAAVKVKGVEMAHPLSIYIRKDDDFLSPAAEAFLACCKEWAGKLIRSTNV